MPFVLTTDWRGKITVVVVVVPAGMMTVEMPSVCGLAALFKRNAWDFSSRPKPDSSRPQRWLSPNQKPTPTRAPRWLLVSMALAPGIVGLAWMVTGTAVGTPPPAGVTVAKPTGTLLTWIGRLG